MTEAEVTKRRHLRPWVVRGGISRWEICTSLQARATVRDKIDYLDRIMGHRHVTWSEVPQDVGLDPGGNPFHGAEESGAFTSARFRDFADRCRAWSAGAPAPIAALNVGLTHPVRPYEFAERIEPIPYTPPLHGRMLRIMWLGEVDYVTALHYDPFQNFIGQIEGYKRITLFPPDVLADIYHPAVDDLPYEVPCSRMRMLPLDLAKWPRFERALPHAVSVVLGPGDLLYTPPLWWHHVESRKFNMMVSTFFHDTNKADVDAADHELKRAIVMLSGLPPSAREACRTWLRRHAFRAGDDGKSKGAASSPDSDVLATVEREAGRSVRRYLEQSSRRFEVLPPYWVRHYALKYDHFVFQMNGDPFPGMPGELEAMRARLARDEPKRVTSAILRANAQLMKGRVWVHVKVVSALRSL